MGVKRVETEERKMGRRSFPRGDNFGKSEKKKQRGGKGSSGKLEEQTGKPVLRVHPRIIKTDGGAFEGE